MHLSRRLRASSSMCHVILFKHAKNDFLLSPPAASSRTTRNLVGDLASTGSSHPFSSTLLNSRFTCMGWSTTQAPSNMKTAISASRIDGKRTKPKLDPRYIHLLRNENVQRMTISLE
ncbi:hypothetical protein V6N11_060191 [Hibiscus sabdariffa]|uniref:Uncharacterized protein n=1 Tax=Hibiscus sabdariffa TaxID=183260 RepID=A0ABR1Z8N3_9ROSI